MKKIKILAALFAGALCLSSCMEAEWDAPDFGGNPPYGNNEIVPLPSKKITIAELKAKYADVFSQRSAYKYVDEDLQLFVAVNGNDQGGNLYKQISVQDETGGIIVGINATDLYAPMPVGQRLVINLKGLCVGTYGSMAQIGGEYNGGLGRMEENVWKQSVRLVGDKVSIGDDPNDPLYVPMTAVADTIDFTPTADRNEMVGRIVRLMDVTINGGGAKTLAPDDGSVSLTGNYANLGILDAPASGMLLRTSTYSDFAARPVPQGKVDIYGVCTHFNGTWQILMRTNSDLVELDRNDEGIN